MTVNELLEAALAAKPIAASLAEAEKNNTCLFISKEKACEIKYSIGVMNKAV